MSLPARSQRLRSIRLGLSQRFRARESRKQGALPSIAPSAAAVHEKPDFRLAVALYSRLSTYAEGTLRAGHPEPEWGQCWPGHSFYGEHLTGAYLERQDDGRYFADWHHAQEIHQILEDFESLGRGW